MSVLSWPTSLLHVTAGATLWSIMPMWNSKARKVHQYGKQKAWVSTFNGERSIEVSNFAQTFCSSSSSTLPPAVIFRKKDCSWEISLDNALMNMIVTVLIIICFDENKRTNFPFLLYINEKWSETVHVLEIHFLKQILQILWYVIFENLQSKLAKNRKEGCT